MWVDCEGDFALHNAIVEGINPSCPACTLWLLVLIPDFSHAKRNPGCLSRILGPIGLDQDCQDNSRPPRWKSGEVFLKGTHCIAI